MSQVTGASKRCALRIFRDAFFPTLVIGLIACAFSLAAVAAERQDTRLSTSTRVLTELMMMPEQNIPAWLLDRAHAVAVVPAVIKVGLGIGGRRGKGVLVVRKDTASGATRCSST